MQSITNWADAIAEEAAHVEDLAAMCPFHPAGRSCLHCMILAVQSHHLHQLAGAVLHDKAGPDLTVVAGEPGASATGATA